MPDKLPVTAEQYLAADSRPQTTWADVRRRLAEARTYWLATVRPDGRPHVMPLLAVWLDGALHFVASGTSRKARNLALSPRCVVTASDPALDLVLEGKAVKVRDEARLHRLAEAYASKYGWPVTVHDGAFQGEGAPTAGPPPYEVYEVVPSVAFGFGTDESLNAMRWRF